MISENRDFLQKHLDYIKSTGTDLKRYLVDNEVDFIVKHYINFDYAEGSFEQEENNLFDIFDKTLVFLEKISQNSSFAIIKMLPGYEVVRSDIDILVHDSKDLCAVIESLSKNGFIKLAYPRFYRWQPANERFKQIWFHKDGKFLNIHLHRHIAWGSVSYIDGNEVFSNLRTEKFFNKCFFIPDSGICLRIILLHAVFENFKLSLKDILEVKELMNRGGQGFAKSNGLDHRWLNLALVLFNKAYLVSKENWGLMRFPVYFSRGKLMQVRLQKIIDDCVRCFSLSGLYFDLESYFFDFLKMFVMKPLRDRKIIK
jgi:hypothetical protein